MPYLSDRILRDSVAFRVATHAVGARGGVTESYATAGTAHRARCEATFGATASDAAGKPNSKARWKVVIQTDPNAGLSRPLLQGDLAVCTKYGNAATVTIQLVGPPKPDSMSDGVPMWLIEGDAVR